MEHLWKWALSNIRMIRLYYSLQVCVPYQLALECERVTRSKRTRKRKKEKTHANLINIWWVILWAAAITVAAVTCLFNGSVSSIDSIHFVSTFTSSELNFFPKPFGIFFSFLHIRNSKYNLNIAWSQGNIFYGTFSGSCHYGTHSWKFLSIMFIFADFFFLIFGNT